MIDNHTVPELETIQLWIQLYSPQPLTIFFYTLSVELFRSAEMSLKLVQWTGEWDDIICFNPSRHQSPPG